MNKRRFIALTAAALSLVSCTTINRPQTGLGYNSGAKNIVFMIVDGMGFEHVKASRIFNGQKPLVYENFSCSSKVTTCAYEGSVDGGHCDGTSPHITDSAAGATAIATGVKVSNGVISKRLPGEKKDVMSILELAKSMGKSTGVVATKLFSDATPAAFLSHANDREETSEILRDMFTGSLPNVVFGADNEEHRTEAKNASLRYIMVHTATHLDKLTHAIEASASCDSSTCPHIYGGFGQYDMIPGSYKNKSGLPLEVTPAEITAKLDTPKLSQMTDAALKMLNKNQQGFFLMVESSMPDMISHYHEQIESASQAPSAIKSLVYEMKEVENTIKVLQDFVAKNPDTLVVLTADHETGGLVIEDDKTDCLGQADCIPSVRWTSPKYEPTKESPAQHTAADVPLYAMGQGARHFCKDKINNTDIISLALTK